MCPVSPSGKYRLWQSPTYLSMEPSFCRPPVTIFQNFRDPSEHHLGNAGVEVWRAPEILARGTDWGGAVSGVQSSSYARWISCGDLLYGTEAIMNKTLLCAWHLLGGQNLAFSLHICKEGEPSAVTDISSRMWWWFHVVYVCQMIKLHALNTYNS